MSELIKISKEFRGITGSLWLGKEVTIPEGADDIEEFIKQSERLDKAWMAMNPQYKFNEQSVGEINKEKERVEIAIDNCTSKAELKMIQESAFKHKLEKEYLMKLKSFE